jgi:5'-3' exonuclease
MNILDIISNTPVSSLAVPNTTLTHNTMGRFDKTRPIILVDTSYWLYYRFFALRTWYKKAFPDSNRSADFDIEHNWLEDGVFMAKFCKLFIDNIKILVRRHKSVMTNVVFCIDCSYKDIWRNTFTTEYKATRPESLRKKGFNAFNVFAYIKKDYLPELQVQYGVKILYHPRCEADDVIGHFAPFLIARGVPMVYVIANDNDYLQICNSRVKMITGNLSADNLQSYSASNSNIPDERYLIRKILLGDVSDNIRGCSVSKVLLENDIQSIREMNLILEEQVYKTISKNNIETLLADNTRYEFFSQLLNAIRKGDIADGNDPRLILIRNFYNNTVLMDFKMIPNDMQKELEIRFASYM